VSGSTYRVRLTKEAEDDLRKLDPSVRSRIIKWLRRRISNGANPRAYGELLSGELGEYWKYRTGDYRIVAKIIDDEVVVLIIATGHRKDIYKKTKRRVT